MYRALICLFIHPPFDRFYLWLLCILLLWTQIILGFSRGTEPIRYIWGDSLKELTHEAMKVKKPQNLPSESWRTRKPWWSNLEWKFRGWGGKSQYESESLRTRSVKVQGKEKLKSPIKQRQWIHPSSLFSAIQAFSGLDGTQWHWWGWSSFMQSTYSDANLFWRCPHRHTPK